MSFYQLQSHKDATLDNKSTGFPDWARTHLWVWHRVVFCLQCSGNICLSHDFHSLRSCIGEVYCCALLCFTLILHIWRKCNEELSPSSYVTDGLWAVGCRPDLWSDVNCSSSDLYSSSIIMSEFKVHHLQNSLPSGLKQSHCICSWLFAALPTDNMWLYTVTHFRMPLHVPCSTAERQEETFLNFLTVMFPRSHRVSQWSPLVEGQATSEITTQLPSIFSHNRWQ